MGACKPAGWVLFGFGILAAVAASAAPPDTDGDEIADELDNCPGIPNDQTDTDGDGWGDACVHPTATLGEGVVLGLGAQIGANSFVGSRASIGDYAQVGENCVVSSRAVIASALSTRFAVQISNGSIVGRNAQLMRGANVSGSIIGRSAVVDTHATIQDSTVGYSAYVGSETVIGPNAVIGNRVSVHARTQVLSGTVIARGSQVGADVEVRASVVVGPDVTIGDGAYIGENARIRKRVQVGELSYVGDGARVGRDVVMGSPSAVLDGVRLSGCNLAPNTIVESDIFGCEVPTVWQADERVGHEEGFGLGRPEGTEVVVDDSGNITVVWSVPNSNNETFARHFDSTSGWGPIHAFSREGRNPHLAVQANGDVASIWIQDHEVWASSFTADAGWTVPSVVWSDPTEGGRVRYARVDLADDGNAVLGYVMSFSNSDSRAYTRLMRPDGSMDAEALVANSTWFLDGISAVSDGSSVEATFVLRGPPGLTVRDVAFAVGSGDVAVGEEHVLMTRFPSEPARLAVSDERLFVGWKGWSDEGFFGANRHAGVWTTTQIAPNPNGNGSLNMVAGAGGTAMFGYQDTHDLMTSTFDPASGWSEPSLAYAGSGGGPIEVGLQPNGTQIGLVRTGTGDGGVALLALEKTSGGDWTQTRLQPNDGPFHNSYEQVLRVGSDGTVVAVWTRDLQSEDTAAGPPYSTLWSAIKR